MDWMTELKNACSAMSQRRVAELIGYSPAVVSQVLKGTYKGDLSSVEEAVKGALMGLTVECPIIGELPRHRCIEHQRRAANFAATNPMRVQLYRMCRSGCPHSQLKGGES